MTKLGKALFVTAVAATAAMASPALAGSVLIINGSSTTSESGTTASITTQLTNLHMAAGNTVTVVDGVPLSLAGYGQVWDIRFSNSSPITAGVTTQYVDYLAAGGGMFVMGENSGFSTRNNSVLGLISAAGGGDLTFTTPNGSQTVFAPFTGPVPVSMISYAAPGGVSTFGTGQWISSNATGGSGVAWAKGTLANAQNGALTVIFDVNFMQTDASDSNQALTRNLIGFVGGQVGGVPEPATWAMMLLGFGALGGVLRRQRSQLRVRFAA